MKPIEMYTRPTCPYCIQAEALLQQKKANLALYDISDQPELKATMIERSGRYTVPQIFIDGKHIGGCDDLLQLEAEGELDKLLT